MFDCEASWACRLMGVEGCGLSAAISKPWCQPHRGRVAEEDLETLIWVRDVNAERPEPEVRGSYITPK